PSRNPSPASGACTRMIWRSRSTAATATPATTTSSSTTGTTASTPSTRAPTASRAWTCWAARWSCNPGPGWRCWRARPPRPPSAAAETAARGRAAGGECAEHADALSAAVARLTEVTAALWADGDTEGGAREALANPSVYLEAAGHVVIAWMWLEQELACDGTD